MELKPLRTYLLMKKGATEETPFGPEALGFKVIGKLTVPTIWRSEG